MMHWKPLVISVLATLVTVGQLASQQTAQWDPERTHMTRSELEELYQRLSQVAASEAYGDALRARSRRQASLVQERLTEGDFQVGDRAYLYVEGEQVLSDTFLVGDGRMLLLPTVGEVPLKGVLRSELGEYLAGRISRNVRDPVVRARSLIRLSIVGAVIRPGYHLVRADLPLPDFLMMAGGPTQDAALNDLRILRGTERLWEGETLRAAMNEGRTIDELSLRTGDQLVVPRARRTSVESVARMVGIFVTIPVAIFGLIRLF